MASSSSQLPSGVDLRLPLLSTMGQTTTSTSTSTYLTAVQIPCCLCGTMIYPNGANQCNTCLAQDFNLQDRIQRGPNGAPHTTIYQCRECRRYMRTEKHFEHSEPESSHLLALCLKHIPALQNSYHSSSSGSGGGNGNTASDHVETKMAPLHVVDAKWIWTEPHSMRLKIHLTVRTELSSVPVQQRCMVELHVNWKQCPDCANTYTSRTWHAIVQVRNKQNHGSSSTSNNNSDSGQTKKGLTVIEMALGRAKPSVRKHILKLDHVKSGFDFYFMSLSNAQAFVSYLQTIVPMRTKTSQKLVSTDSKNNTAHVKHTITADIVPLQKHDLIVVDKSTPKTSLAGTIAIVLSVSSGMILLQDACPRLLRPVSKKATVTTATTTTMLTPIVLSADSYYKHEKNYTVVQSSSRMIRFVVLDVELVHESAAAFPSSSSPIGNDADEDHQTVTSTRTRNSRGRHKNYGGPASSRKYALAEVEVARESDLGKNNDTFRVLTHLGHMLNAGDVALGYDLTATTRILPGSGGGISREQSDRSSTWAVRNNFVLPDIVLIKKASAASSSKSGDDDYYDDTIYSVASKRRGNGGDDYSSKVSQGGGVDDDDGNHHHHHHSGSDDDNEKRAATSDDYDDDDDEDEDTQSHFSTRSTVTTEATPRHRSTHSVASSRSGKKSLVGGRGGDDDDRDDGKPRISKKKLRRQLRHEGKRSKQLERSAMIMGLLPPSSDLDPFREDDENDDDDGDDDDPHRATNGRNRDEHAGPLRPVPHVEIPSIESKPPDLGFEGELHDDDDDDSDPKGLSTCATSFDKELHKDRALAEQLLMLELNERETKDDTDER